MRFNSYPLPAVLCVAFVTGLSFAAQAEVAVNAGAKVSHESNVNGSPIKANQLSDSYLALNASAVYYTALDAAQTSYFIGQLGASTSSYNRFNSLNNSMLGASAGLYKQLSPTWSGQVTGRGFVRDTKQSERDSKGMGATLEVKNQLSKALWVKGIVDYENSKAKLGAFGYRGATYGVNLGYLPLKDTFVNLGYSHAKRDFKTTSPFKTTSKTLFADVTQRIAKNWYVNGGYAYQDNNSNIAGTAYTNHIVSVGLNFSY